MLYSRFIKEAPAAQRSKSADRPRKPKETMVPEGVEELRNSWTKMDMPHRAVCTQVPERRGNSRSIKSGHLQSKPRQSLQSLNVQQSQKRTIRLQAWRDIVQQSQERAIRLQAWRDQAAHSPPAEPINDATNKTCEQACNNKSSVGFVGMASEVSLDNEFQFSGTTHFHGLSPHAGMCQVRYSVRR